MKKTWILASIAALTVVGVVAADELKPHDPAVLENLKGYRIRVVKQGQMMDHAVLQDRITVWVDAQNHVTEAKYQ